MLDQACWDEWRNRKLLLYPNTSFLTFWSSLMRIISISRKPRWYLSTFQRNSTSSHSSISLVKNQTKLLGVTLSSDLSWSAHINDITKRATRKLWVILRFKALGGTRYQLLSVYQLRIRSTLEFAAPVFHSGMTQDQSRKVEMVQKKIFAWFSSFKSHNQYNLPSRFW